MRTKKIRRFHKRGGNTSSDLRNMEEGYHRGLRSPKKADTYVIDIKDVSLPQKHSKKKLYREKSFPYEEVILDPRNIKDVVQDLRPFPPKASPIQFEDSPPLAKQRIHIPTRNQLLEADYEDEQIPVRLTNPMPSVIVLDGIKVQDQKFNPFKSWSSEEERPFDLAFGYRSKTRRLRNHTKKRHSKRQSKRHSKRQSKRHSKRQSKRHNKK